MVRVWERRGAPPLPLFEEPLEVGHLPQRGAEGLLKLGVSHQRAHRVLTYGGGVVRWRWRWWRRVWRWEERRRVTWRSEISSTARRGAHTHRRSSRFPKGDAVLSSTLKSEGCAG